MKRLNDNELAMVHGGSEYCSDIEFQWEVFPDVIYVDTTFINEHANSVNSTFFIDC